MPFGTNDMQSAQLYDAFVILFALAHLLQEKVILFRFCHVVNILLDGLFFFSTLILVVFWHFPDVADVLGMFAQDTIQVASWVSTQHNVGTAAGHVGGYSDGPTTPGLGNDLRLACVVFRIEYIMGYALPFELLGQVLRVLDRSGTNQDRYTLFVQHLDVFNHGIIFCFGCAIDQVGQVLANHRFMRRDLHNIQLIDFIQFFRLCDGGTRHTGQLLIQAEKVLVGNRSESMILALHLDALFRLDSLVETLTIATSRHLAACELVYDDYLAILHDVIFIALKDDLGLNGVLHVARQLDVVLIVDVFHTGQLLKLIDTGIGQYNGACLFLNGIVNFRLQARRPAGKLDVHIRGLLPLARNDERSTRFVDKDIINFVHDGIV